MFLIFIFQEKSPLSFLGDFFLDVFSILRIRYEFGDLYYE